MSRIYRALRSRRLAAALLVGLTLYMWLTTLVPLSSIDPAAASRWDAEHPLLAGPVRLLGLHHAYSSPLFIVAAMLLTLSTAACAAERTSAAIRTFRGRWQLSDGVIHRLRDAPTFVVAGGGRDSERLLADASAVLEGMRLAVRRGPRALVATSPTLAIAGSPLFHWALVALFVLVFLGQLTRYEGFANVAVGTTFEESVEGYGGLLTMGPLAPSGLSGIALRVDDIDLEHEAGGVARGATPYVVLRTQSGESAEGWVYPNQPLRAAGLVVHRTRVGPALLGTVTSGGSIDRVPLAIYFDTASAPQQFEVKASGQDAARVFEVTPVAGQRVSIHEVEQGSRRRVPVASSVGVDQPVELGGGVTLAIDDLTGYAQLKVVKDASVGWIYVTFLLGSIGLAVALFLPWRTVRVLAVDEEGGAGTAALLQLNVLVSAPRGDPAFVGRVQHAMGAASRRATDDASATDNGMV